MEHPPLVALRFDAGCRVTRPRQTRNGEAMWRTYNAHSAAERLVQASAAGLVRRAADAMCVGANGAASCELRVVAVGCGPGANDAALLDAEVLPQAVRSCGDGAVEVVWADQPHNQWQQLFDNAAGLRAKHPKAFCSAVAGSFEDPLVRPSSTHLTLAFSCLHWIAQLPPDLPSKATSWVALPKNSVHRRELLEISDRALHRFFQCRFRELVPGGRLVLGMDGETAETDHQFAGACLTLQDALLDVAASGSCPQAVADGFFINAVPGSEDRIRRAATAAGFRVEHLSTPFLDCPFLAQLERDGDNAKFGEAIAHSLQAVFHGFFRELVIKHVSPSPAELEVSRIIDSIFSRVADLAASSPARSSSAGTTLLASFSKPPT